MPLCALLPALLLPSVGGFALVVGNNRPDNVDAPILRYADDDALAMDGLLRRAGMKTVLLTTMDEDTARLASSSNVAGPPTQASIRTAMHQLHEEMARTPGQGDFYFFFSGHGDVDHGEGYLTLEDGHFSRTQLYETVLGQSLAANNHVMVDACRSYFLAFEKGDKGTRQPVTPGFSLARAPPTNTGFILSTSSDRESHEWERYQGGVFSHQLLSALWGAADTNLDGVVGYDEVAAFMETANVEIANARYRPDALALGPAGGGGALLAWPDQQGLLMDDAVSVQRYLEDARGIRVADLHPSSGQMLLMHLPEQRPIYVADARSSEERVCEGTGVVRFSTLGAQPQALAKGSLNLAFERMFARSFGQKEVDAYVARKAHVAAAVPEQRRMPWRMMIPAAASVAAGVLALTLGALGFGSMALAAVRYLTTAQGISAEELRNRNNQILLLDAATVGLFAFAMAALAVGVVLTSVVLGQLASG